MKRVIAQTLPAIGSQWSPASDEAHHLIRVRRCKPGEEIEILDGRGGLALGRVVALDKRQLTLEILDHPDVLRESPLHLEIAAALPVQQSTLDAALPGLVQLGMNRLYVCLTEYSGRLKKDAGKYLLRLENIAQQSLKQCGRLVLPEIRLVENWRDLCGAMVESNQANLLLHPVERRSETPSELTRLGLLIGPEGGFSTGEVQTAVDAGIQLKGLGPRILKQETALIGAAHWAQAVYGDAR